MTSVDGNTYSGIKEKILHLKSHYDKGGISGLASQFTKDLNEWKDVHIKIAVTGRSGAGKSSFVNAIRGITADDVEMNPAAVDVKECTTSVQEYTYPGNNNFRLYDLPGLGTPRFQEETYLTDVGFEQYDLFIIIAATRFMNEDLWLARRVEESGKPFYFVRSKIENDIRSDKRAHPKTHKETALLNKVREDLKSNLGSFTVKDIFLIDNYDIQAYEFGLLTAKLIRDSKEMKQDALVFSLACLSEEVIEEKKKTLERRIPMISSFAGVLASFVSASFNDPTDSSFVLKEIQFYGEQFRVDTTSLSVDVEACALSEDERSRVKDEMYSHDQTMLENLQQSLFHLMNYVPVIGNITLGIKCAQYLQECLDETAKRAKDVHGIMAESLAKKCTL